MEYLEMLLKFLPSLAATLTVYVALRERLLRAEIKIKTLEEEVEKREVLDEKFNELIKLLRDDYHKLDKSISYLSHVLECKK